jgi:hypothetical protein
MEESIKEIQDITQSNIYKILQRGDNLHNLSEKVDSLRDTSSLFKKRARQLKEEVKPVIQLSKLNIEYEQPILKKQASLDYLTENEETQLSEYEEQLMEHYLAGQYQYVLDKASQLGLLRFVKRILELSSYHPLDLNIAYSLNMAAYYGHIEVIETLLSHDIDNERYYGKAPREEVTYLLPFFEDKPRIPYTNEPLTHEDIRKAIISAYSANHNEVANVLEAYYYKTHAIKDRHDNKKADKFLAKII